MECNSVLAKTKRHPDQRHLNKLIRQKLNWYVFQPAYRRKTEFVKPPRRFHALFSPFFLSHLSSLIKVCAKFSPKWNINSRKCYVINLSSDTARLKIITLYWALNFLKQEATYIWRTLTVFPVEPNKSLNNLVLLAGYYQVWPKLNMKSAARVLTSKTSRTSKTSKGILSFNQCWYFYTIMILIFT